MNNYTKYQNSSMPHEDMPHEGIPRGQVPPFVIPMHQGSITPTGFGRELDRLQVPLELVKEAIDVRSDIHDYAQFKVATTMASFMMIKQMHAATGLLPIIEPWLMQHAQRYLLDIDDITGVATEKILTALRAYDPAKHGQKGFWDIVNNLMRYL